MFALLIARFYARSGYQGSDGNEHTFNFYYQLSQFWITKIAVKGWPRANFASLQHLETFLKKRWCGSVAPECGQRRHLTFDV